MDVLRMLLSAPPAAQPIDSFDGWWSRHRALAERFARPVDVALAGGFSADRLGYAFASGYAAAGHALFGKSGRRGALCATEAQGAHPRHIHCALRRDPDGWRLSGEKRFVTFGQHAELLYVVCSVGHEDGHNDLRVVAIEPREGVVMTPLADTPFVPEIPHAAVHFKDVRVADHEIMEGDGYLRYLKPFRTVEDVHVHAALVGWLIQVGRGHSGWAPAILERLASIAMALREIARGDPSAPEIHVALGGTLAASASLVEGLDWSRVDEETRSRWERDHVLLRVAGTARDKRLVAAWRRLELAS